MAEPAGYHEIAADLDGATATGFNGEAQQTWTPALYGALWLDWAETELELEVEALLERRQQFADFLRERGDEYPI